jgi:hypothetical protein
MMAGFETIRIAAAGVRSLLWYGDELVDWVGGCAAWGLDGSHRRQSVNFAYRFDAVVASPDRRWVVIYERLGTKGLLLKDGKIVREINRSFYHAHVYDFPILLLGRSDGRTLLVHCPDEYCRLEIEDAATGERLTASDERKPIDFFYAQLSANPSGTHFASAGWIWHPFDAVVWFDVDAVLANPRLLERESDGGGGTATAWLDDSHIVVATSAESEEANGLAIYDVAAGKCVRELVLDEPPGLIAPMGENRLLSFYRCPRVISLDDGRIEHTFPELNTGRQIGSIAIDKWDSPPIAVDAINRRFAVADEEQITIVRF